MVLASNVHKKCTCLYTFDILKLEMQEAVSLTFYYDKFQTYIEL